MATTQTVASQRARFGATAGLYTIVIIAILAAINYLGVRFNKPLDLTSNKRFTLSQETQKIIGNLKQDATITYFDTSRNFDQARGVLDRYKNLSPKIHVEYVDLKTQPMRAREYGVRFQGTAFVEEGSRREEAKSFDEQGPIRPRPTSRTAASARSASRRPVNSMPGAATPSPGPIGWRRSRGWRS